jgi:nucleoside phosphorylase/CheY-like chemotaxis protein
MIQVLIIDDNLNKIKILRNLLDKNSGIKGYDVAQDVIDAKRYLQSNFYDLVILDLKIPKRVGDDPFPENCINLLKELNQGDRLVKPSNIIGLTEYDDLKNQYQIEFENFLWLIILYESNSILWEKQLKTKIEYLIKAKSTLLISSSTNHQFDLAFITALRNPELNFVLKLPLQWESFKIANDSSEYNKAQLEIQGRKISFLAVSAPQMGMIASSVLTMKVIHSFRPKYIVMTGIAAGIEGKSNYGDILITELAFDYTSGKTTIDTDNKSIFEPDFKTIELSRDLLEDVQCCMGKRDFLDEIKNNWSGDNKPDTSLEIHIGPLASGGGVVEDKSISANIKLHSRKLIGLDMETYGVYYAANNCSKPKPQGVISIKSVSDFANTLKKDKYQNYASYTSASFAYKFFIEKVLNQ